MDFFVWFFNLDLLGAVLFLIKVIILCLAFLTPMFIIAGSAWAFHVFMYKAKEKRFKEVKDEYE